MSLTMLLSLPQIWPVVPCSALLYASEASCAGTFALGWGV